MWVRFPVDSLPEGPPRFASPYGAKSRGGTLEAAAALAGLRISMEGGGSGGDHLTPAPLLIIRRCQKLCL